MLGNFFKYFFLSKDAKNHCFLPTILLIYNLNVKQFGSQMKPHILWGFIWIQIVCKGHQRSSKFTASGLRVKQIFFSNLCITNYVCLLKSEVKVKWNLEHYKVSIWEYQSNMHVIWGPTLDEALHLNDLVVPHLLSILLLKVIIYSTEKPLVCQRLPFNSLHAG